MKIEPLQTGWEAIIHCRPSSYPVVKIQDDKGGITEKTVAPEELIRLLSESQVAEDTQWKEMPILPEHCYRYTESKDGEIYKALLLLPAHNRDTWLFDSRIEGVAFPTLMFGFVVKGEVVHEKYVVAIKDDLVTDNTPVYHYPYSNVYNDARACWSDLPRIAEPRQLGTLPELFFASPDTLHLGAKNSSGLEYRELLEKYRGQRFPREFLIPRNETVIQFWERL